MNIKTMMNTAAMVLLAAAVGACSSTTHPVEPAKLGKNVSDAVMEQQLDGPGPMVVETVVSATWAVPLSGLVNLKDPQAAQLKDHEEPIQVFAHVLRHPVHGNFLVDTGVSAKLFNNPSGVGVNWLVQKAMKLNQMQLKKGTADIVAGLPGPLAGVFFTHLHIDHISGMPDIDAKVPLYVGTAESTGAHPIQMFTQGPTDALLKGKATLQEWPFAMRTQPLGKDAFEAVLDVFGDGSVFAIYTPGHTDGSTAYLVRSTQGPVLLVGDTSHTQWGWDHGVEPGDFTNDHARNRESLTKLKSLVARHPGMQVRLGHQ
jgi:glyoxylase-like metal-dependent hydrolase (beta-lactamase superfamily II)